MLCQEFMPKGDLWRALAQDRTGQLGWYNRWDPQPWLSMQLASSQMPDLDTIYGVGDAP